MGFSVSKIIFQPPLKPTYSLNFVDIIDDIAIKWIPYNDNKIDITILYSHGNACDIGIIFEEMKAFGKKFKCNILLWDYPGYGHSKGKSSEESITKTIQKVYDYWLLKLSEENDKLILMGTSLGTGATCHLASYLSNFRHDFINHENHKYYDGIILECPLSSVISTVLPQTLAYSSYSVDMFTNYWLILNVDKPVFIIHGEKDLVIPWKASETLSKNLGKNLYEFWLVQNAGHNNLRTIMPEEYYDKISFFISYIYRLNQNV